MRGEDRKDDELETVSENAFRALLTELRRRLWRCILVQYGMVGVLGVRNINDLNIECIEIRTWRSSDVNIFATENTSGNRMAMDEHGKMGGGSVNSQRPHV